MKKESDKRLKKECHQSTKNGFRTPLWKLTCPWPYGKKFSCVFLGGEEAAALALVIIQKAVASFDILYYFTDFFFFPFYPTASW